MATPRQNYFFVTEALCRAGLTNDQLACALRLMGVMNDQRARDGLTPEEAVQIKLNPGALADVTGKRQPRAARTLLECTAHALRTLAKYSVSADCTRAECVEIKWDNLADLQRWTARVSGESRPHLARELPSPTPTPTPTPTPEEKNKSAARRSSAAKSAARQGSLIPAAPAEPPAKPQAPGQLAMAIFCEEFKAVQGCNPIVPVRDIRDLSEQMKAMGEGRYRRALQCYFDVGKKDEWIRKQGHSAREFLRQLTKMDLRAQKRAEYGKPMQDGPSWLEEETRVGFEKFPNEEDALRFIGMLDDDQPAAGLAS